MAVLCLSLPRWSLETWYLAAGSVTFQTLSKRWRRKGKWEFNSGSSQVTITVNSVMSLHCNSSKLWITREEAGLASAAPEGLRKSFFLLHQSGSSWVLRSLVRGSVTCPWLCVILLRWHLDAFIMNSALAKRGEKQVSGALALPNAVTL